MSVAPGVGSGAGIARTRMRFALYCTCGTAAAVMSMPGFILRSLSTCMSWLRCSSRSAVALLLTRMCCADVGAGTCGTRRAVVDDCIIRDMAARAPRLAQQHHEDVSALTRQPGVSRLAVLCSLLVFGANTFGLRVPLEDYEMAIGALRFCQSGGSGGVHTTLIHDVQSASSRSRPSVALCPSPQHQLRARARSLRTLRRVPEGARFGAKKASPELLTLAPSLSAGWQLPAALGCVVLRTRGSTPHMAPSEARSAARP